MNYLSKAYHEKNLKDAGFTDLDVTQVIPAVMSSFTGKDGKIFDFYYDPEDKEYLDSIVEQDFSQLFNSVDFTKDDNFPLISSKGWELQKVAEGDHKDGYYQPNAKV